MEPRLLVLTQNRDRNGSQMGTCPVFPQENALPGSQGQPALRDRNRQIGGRKGTPNMGRHVIWSFIYMSIERVTIGHQAPKECLEIGLHVRVGIFLNQQRCGCVVNEHAAQTRWYACACHGVTNLVGNGVQSAAGCLDLECVLRHEMNLHHP